MVLFGQKYHRQVDLHQQIKVMLFHILREISNDLIAEATNFSFVRSELFTALNPPKQNVVILKGAHGIGKSTLIQQFLLNQQKMGNKVLYISADSTFTDVGATPSSWT